MKDFLGILQKMYGVKDSYKTHQIVEAYNAFCLNQVVEIKNSNDLKKQGYYTITEKGHKWENRTVKSSMKPNDDGMCICYFGTQWTYVHKSKLQ